jgi:hypothetical protein
MRLRLLLAAADGTLFHSRMFARYCPPPAWEGLPPLITLLGCLPRLQYLCLENLRAANSVFAAFKEEFAADGSLNTPLINFVAFCEAVRSTSIGCFRC